MTDTTENPAMPAALAAILQEPGWVAACLGHCWRREWIDDMSDLVATLQVSDGTFSGRRWQMVPCFIQSKQAPEEVYAVADLMRRIEAALAPDGPDQGGA